MGADPSSEKSAPTPLGRAGRAALAMLSGNGLLALMQLIFIPVLLAAWGTQMAGEWFILYTIPAYFMLADFGVTVVAANKIEDAAARGDKAAALRIYGTSFGLLILALAAIVGAIIAAAFVWRGSLFAFFEYLPDKDILPLIAWLSLCGAVSIVLYHQAQLFRVVQAFHLTNYWHSGAHAAAMAAIAASAATGAGPVAAAQASLGVQAAALAVLSLHLRRLAPWLPSVPGGFSVAEARRLAGPSLSYLLLPLSNAMIIHAPVAIIGAVLGPSATALFVAMRTFTRFATQIIGIAGRAAWSEINRLAGAADEAALTRAFYLVVTGAAGLSAAFAGGYLLFGELVFGLWTGAAFAGAIPSAFLVVMAAAAVLAGAAQALDVFLLSTNRHQAYTALFFTLACVQLAFGAAFTDRFGLYAFPVAATACGVVLLGFVVHRVLALTGGRVRFTEYAAFLSAGLKKPVRRRL